MDIRRTIGHVHDPHKIFLRRALRLAVAFPLTMVILWPVLGFPTSSVLYGAFGCFGTTTMLDLSGRIRTRLVAYSATLAASWVAIVIATAVGFSVWSAVLATLIWGSVVTFAGVLRGYVAAGIPMVLIPWFLAISSPHDKSRLGSNLVCWTVGFLLASSFAMLMMPVRLHDRIRAGLADVLRALARVVEARWVEPDGDLVRATSDLHDAEERLNERLLGVLVRPGGATGHERHRMQLVDVVRQMSATSLRFPERDATLAGPDARLAEECVRSLRDSASCVLSTGGKHVRPDVLALNRERESHRAKSAAQMRSDLTPDNASAVVQRVANQEILRLTSGLCILAASHARGSVGDDPRFMGMGTMDGKPIYVILPAETPMAAIRSNAHPGSIWLRNSLRAGVGFALAVLIMLVTGIAHGFWIALAVFSALRFDASGSRRTIRQVLIGTVVGFVVGSVLTAITRDSPPIMWVLLAISVALATYTPGATTMIVGQASFSVFLIVLFGLLTPDRLGTAVVRVVDVVIAVAVTFVVSGMMWPGGAATLVRGSLRRATAAAAGYLSASYHRLATGPESDEKLAESEREAARAYLRAIENFDLATAKQVPGGVPLDQWVRAANAVAEVLAAAQKIVFFARTSGAGQICPISVRALDDQAAIVAREFASKVDRSCGVASEAPTRLPEPDLGQHLVASCLAALADREGGRLTERQAASALILVWSLRTLANIRAAAVEVLGAGEGAVPASSGKSH